MSMGNKLKGLRKRRERLKQGGQKEAVEELHKQGMLNARERIERLFDPGSFVELDIFVKHRCTDFGMNKREIPAEGVITGYGRINERLAFAFSQDFTAMGGSFGEMHGKKICKALDMAAEVGAPFIGICHSGGARLQEVLPSQAAFGELFYRNSVYSGVIPQISAIMGSVAGGQAYSPGLTDFIFMTKDSSMFIAGPAFVKTQLNEEITQAELGGARMHAQTSGVCHVIAEDDEDCLLKIKNLLTYLPLNNREKPPFVETGDDPNRRDEELNRFLPENSWQPFSMKDILFRVIDNGEFFEIHARWARSVIVGFARLGGYPVGIIASEPMVASGCIDVWAAEKATRFVSFCDAFNIPIIFFQDTPGYLIGSQQERLGMIYRGATLLHAVSVATVPKIAVIVRKAYAGAYVAMGSKYLGADQVFAWPSAEIGGVAPETAAGIIFRREIEAAESPQEVKERRLKEYYDKFVNPYYAAELQYIDDIIEPPDTRPRLMKALAMLSNKGVQMPCKKHGNPPL